eukprot:7837907-Pyramimonas_sp.AAC.1
MGPPDPSRNPIAIDDPIASSRGDRGGARNRPNHNKHPDSAGLLRTNSFPEPLPGPADAISRP